MKPVLFLIGLTVLTSTSSITHTASAGVSPKCIKSVMGQFERAVKKINGSLSYNGTPKQSYDHLKRSSQDLKRLLKGGSYGRCAKASPENAATIKAFFGTIVKPLAKKINHRGNQLCLAEFERLRTYYDKQINAAVKSGNAGLAAGKLSNLKFDLTHPRKMPAQCKNLKPKIQDFLAGEFAVSEKNVANLVPITQLRNEYKSIARLWDQGNAAIKSKSEKARLDGSQIISDFTNGVKRCTKAISALDAANYKGTIESINGKQITFATARKACELVQKFGAEKFAAKTTAYNKEFATNWQKSWEDKNIKGADMKSVYAAHSYNNQKSVPRVKKLGDITQWTYHTYTSRRLFADCIDYTFTANGKLLKQTKYLCER